MPPKSYLSYDWSPLNYLSHYTFTPAKETTMLQYVIIYDSRQVYQTMANNAEEAITKFEKEPFTAEVNKFAIHRLLPGGLSFIGEYKFTNPRRAWSLV